MNEFDFRRSLGDAVKRSRGKADLTQVEVANRAGIDVRTVLNIENYRGNPKMEVVSAIVRTLTMDPREIFYPEHQLEGDSVRKLRLLLAECNEDEAGILIPVIETILDALRSNKTISLK